MILLKNILIEAKLYSFTTKELLDKILNFKGKTLIFLDDETTGLEPNVSYNQITQISALVVDGSTMKVIDELNIKVNLGWKMFNLLNDPNSFESKSFEKDRQRSLRRYNKDISHPRDILKLTHYYETKSNEIKMDEDKALIELEGFLSQFSNVILIAHNATFDIKAIQARRRINKLSPMQKFPVLDTIKISRFFFIPLLLSLEGNEQAKKYLQALIAKTKFKSYASSLSRLAEVFKIKITGWHQASEDVKMLFEVLNKLIEFLTINKDIDIRKQQEIQAKRLRHMK